jgi:hypothetical protein
MAFVRLLVRPFGYLLFVLAVLLMSGAAKLLGERDELGFFAGRLSKTIWRYPEVTRPGIQVGWLIWAVLLVVSASPLDPLASGWDEVGLFAAGLGVAWHRTLSGRRERR